MNTASFRVVEALFTAYAIPGLLVPFVWLAGRLFARRRAVPEDAADLARLEGYYLVVAVGWLAAWVALRAGIPLERGGSVAAALSWAAYAALNLAFARLLIGFTSGYGGVPEGPAKDRLFLGLLSMVVAQPLSTGCAFAVLYRIMGVVYHMSVPGLAPIQEGI
jgi:hypothetical protein